MVTSLDYYVTEEFVEGIYDSCKDVYYPAGDMKAVESMCGSLGPLCNAKRWFDFMGQESAPVGNGLAPFTIKYKYLNESTMINGRNITPFTDTAQLCEKSVRAYPLQLCFISCLILAKTRSLIILFVLFYCTLRIIDFGWTHVCTELFVC